jgi:hypothetical protein
MVDLSGVKPASHVTLPLEPIVELSIRTIIPSSISGNTPQPVIDKENNLFHYL